MCFHSLPAVPGGAGLLGIRDVPRLCLAVHWALHIHAHIGLPLIHFTKLGLSYVFVTVCDARMTSWHLTECLPSYEWQCNTIPNCWSVSGVSEMPQKSVSKPGVHAVGGQPHIT